MTLQQVSVVLVGPVAVFEFGVPVEVFGIDRTEDGLPRFDFRLCAIDPERPLAAGHVPGLSITATHSLDAVADSDLVIVAATPRLPDDQYPPAVLETLRAAHRAGSTLLSLCSGAFILGAAGLLDGLDCTTHWKYAAELQERHPSARVDPGVLFVDAGSIITSAGTAAGIDACLHLVRRELGASAATKIARRMVVPPQRDGGQQQYLDYPEVECCTGGLADVLDWAIDNLDQPLTIASLAARAHLSQRTFARRFGAETGTTPHHWLTGQRVAAARQLLETSDETVERIAALVGFNSAVVLRDHFRRHTGVAPVAYRRQFSVREA
jgi:AraC family transcriptional regulator, transcriptional activator FtrA